MTRAPRQLLFVVTIGMLVFAAMPITRAAPIAVLREARGAPVDGLRIRDELGDEVPVVNERRRRRLHVEDSGGATIEATAWRTDNPDVATVTRKGVVRGRRYGFVTVTAVTSSGEVRADVVVVRVTTEGSAPVRGEARSDLSGAIYLSSPETHVVYRSDGTRDKVFVGVVGEPGFVDGAGTEARLRTPAGLGIDQRASGGIYVAEVGNHCIRRVSPDGRTRVALGTPTVPGRSVEVLDEEPAAAARLSSPSGVAVRGSDILVADSDNDALVFYSATAGVVRLLGGQPGVPGDRDGIGREARFRTPTGLAISTDGSLLAVADTGNDTVRLVRLEDAGGGRIRGIVSTLGRATSAKGNLPTGGPPGDAFVFDNPKALAFDGIGSVCVIDALGAAIVTRPESRLPSRLRLAESGSLGRPVAVTVQGTRVLVLDANARGRHEAVRVVEVGAPSIVSARPDVYELEGGEEVVVDGVNFAPESVVTMGERIVDNLVIERSTRLRFRVPVTTAPGTRTLSIATRGGVAQVSVTVRPPSIASLGPGELTAILGGGIPETGDGGLLSAPQSVIQGAADLVADSAGNVFIADRARVRRVDAVTGIITTVAGNGVPGNSGDGGPAVAASLEVSLQLEIVDNDLFILSGQGQLRRVDFDTGRISTVAPIQPRHTLYEIAATPAGQLLGAFRDSDPLGHVTVERIDPATGDGTVLWTEAEQEVSGYSLLAVSETTVLTSAGPLGELWKIDLESGEAERVAGGGTTAVSYVPVAANDARLGHVIDLDLAADGTVLLTWGSGTGLPSMVARFDPAASTVVALAGGGTRGASEHPIASNRVGVGFASVLSDSSGRILVGSSHTGLLALADGNIRLLGGARESDAPFPADGDATKVSRYRTNAIAFGPDGKIVIVEDYPSLRLRVFDPVANTIETIAGNGVDAAFRDRHDGMPAREVPLGAYLEDVAVGPDGSVYLSTDVRILRITGGRAFIHAGNGTFERTREGIAGEVPVTPARLAVASDGTVYFTEGSGQQSDTLYMVRDGRIERFAGGVPGTCPPSGTLDELRTDSFGDIAIALDGDLLVSDEASWVIHRIDLESGTYRREAGVGRDQEPCGPAECTATLASLEAPDHLGCDSLGRLYVLDAGFGLLRRDQDGILRLMTGTNGRQSGNGNVWNYGHSGTEYGVAVTAIAVDASGNLVIADSSREGLLYISAASTFRRP